jgi:small subunit ribosomal protein S3
MGQKVSPIGARLGINKTWDSRWFSGRKTDYAKKLHEDLSIRKYVFDKLAFAGISKVIIERSNKKIVVVIHTSKPGAVIGKRGTDIEKIKSSLAKFTADEIQLNIVEVRKAEIDATLVAQSIAQQIEKRISFKRAMKKAVQTALRFGAQGIRVNCAGRLGGAEIARTEWYREGRVPLHTLRADIDYGVWEAKTTYGIIGIKVWIFKGETAENDDNSGSAKYNIG